VLASRIRAAKDVQKLIYQIRQNPDHIVRREQVLSVVDSLCEAVLETMDAYLEELNDAANNK
jgi:hypothetical protein